MSTNIELAGARNKKRSKRTKKQERHNSTPETPTSPPPHDPVTAADAPCSGPLNFGLLIPNINGRLARKFIAGASGSLARVELPDFTSAGTAGNCVVGLSAADGPGVPDNSLLATATVLDTRVPDGTSTDSFAFANPLNSVAGMPYALILSRPGSNQMVWSGHTGKTREGESYSGTSQTGPFTGAFGDVDLHFTSFVTS